MPFRTSPLLDRVPRRVVAGGLAVSAICGLVLLPPVLDSSRVRRPAGAGAGAVAQSNVVLTPVPADFDQLAVKEAGYRSGLGCQTGRGRVCTYEFGDGPHIALMGDSNALMIQSPLHELAKREGLTFTLGDAPGCVWQSGIASAQTPGERTQCSDAREPFYEGRLAELEVDVVVAINVMKWKHLADPAGGSDPEDQELRAATEESVEKILASGAELVVIEPMPRAPSDLDPIQCMGEATSLEECRFVVDERPYWFEELLRDLDADHEAMHLIDLDRAVCPDLPVCDPVVGGEVVRWDGAHLTKAFSQTLVDDLTVELESLGVLDR